MKKKQHAEQGRGQKLMSFRADFETLKVLEAVENKGRLINELVQEWGRSRNVDESAQEYAPNDDERENDACGTTS